MVIENPHNRYLYTWRSYFGRTVQLPSFVCGDCAEQNHENCMLRNEGKIRSDCDCQHGTKKESGE